MKQSSIRLVDAGWNREFEEAILGEPSEVRIVCPFIKEGALKPLLSRRLEDFQVITRFNLDDIAKGVSDLEALRMLLDAGASVRGIKNLHAKLYLFGTTRAIITSANLTKAALTRNQEFGLVADDETVIVECRNYFDELWQHCSSADLSRDRLDCWAEKVTLYRLASGRSRRPEKLGDFGADAGLAPPLPIHPVVGTDVDQAFIKFLGKSDYRAPVSCSSIEVIQEAGCHWALCYPANKRPRSVNEGAVMFIARLTDEPDIRIFGRSIGMKYQPVRDDATTEEIAVRSWKETWPHYVRVHHAEFVAGTMENGISLKKLMDALGSDSFASTQRNASRGTGNSDPRRAFRQQAAVELSEQAIAWLSGRLQAAFDEHGKVPQDMLDQLDWPSL